ncbi:MAG TPA: HAD-IA family hydrolase [Candidatus Babeliales bacterium]|nr:HAD-IA family hydrolase [Candidatus Babeliales bacterium]
MRLYHYVSISFLLIFIYTVTKTPHNQRKITCSDATCKKYTILFDLPNVLIKENQTGFSKKIGYGKLASYAITHWKNPGYRCLDMLAAMSALEEQKPHITITLKNRILPRCLVELQEGKKTCVQARMEITQCIELLDAKKHFSSVKEKKLMTTIMNLVLDPETIEAIIEPIKSTVQLAQKLKAAGHTIYIFANAPDELYTSLQKKYTDMINLFDGVVVSSQVKTAKPNDAIFKHLIEAHNINPQDCILIDDLAESVATAKKLGMQGIVYDKISHVTSKLKKCGVRL